ncbi:uncharacterized protein EV420DRAFT_1525173 [Desarmillaria tabescens]|uniref:Uncharacterized protein n=1 Tax=Armillaria tabescens TaxID=1929756 RepID=A0AA39TKN5_ARMTA|nr:uncharacterized protein EV420DRAFT_1525173 [Desarmillaria tabescens]KAK0462492.1 hypothetical protein EV420DRAFT_1525173 [Desarmillaria tabescens]
MSPLHSSSSPSFLYTTDYAPAPRIGPTMDEPISTNLTTEPGFPLGDYGLFEEETPWDDKSQEEVAFLVQPQDKSSSPLPVKTSTDKPAISVSFNENVDLSPIPMSKFQRARANFAPEMSYLALLESRLGFFPPSKGRRVCMSHISVPPLPHDKSEYRTLRFPNRASSNFAKAKSPGKSKAGLIQRHEHIRATYQADGAMLVNKPFSGSLSPLATKPRRGPSHSSDDAATRRSKSQEFEVIPSPRKRRRLSIDSMGSFPPKKKPKRYQVREVRPRSSDVDEKASVTEDSDNYSTQDDEYVTDSEVVSVNLRPRTRSTCRHNSESDRMEWHDTRSGLELDVDIQPTATPPPPLMSAKARGKQKAIPIHHEKDSLSPQPHIDVDFSNDMHLEDNHYSDPHTVVSPSAPDSYANGPTSPPHSASPSEEHLLDSFPDLSFFEKYAPLQKHSLPNFWFQGCSIPHGQTLDPSLLGGLGFTDLHDLMSPSPLRLGSPGAGVPLPQPLPDYRPGRDISR